MVATRPCLPRRSRRSTSSMSAARPLSRVQAACTYLIIADRASESSMDRHSWQSIYDYERQERERAKGTEADHAAEHGRLGGEESGRPRPSWRARQKAESLEVT